MKVKWDDDAPYEFLMKYGVNHEKKNLLKPSIGAIRRLKFKEISIDEIEMRDPPYKIFIPRLEFHAARIAKKKSFGTLFCRLKDNGKWHIKDGNHRFYILVAHGIKQFRIAYDPENEI